MITTKRFWAMDERSIAEADEFMTSISQAAIIAVNIVREQQIKYSTHTVYVTYATEAS